MTAKEIREKETDHLKDELIEKRKHLFDLRSQAVTEKLEDPSQLRKTTPRIVVPRAIATSQGASAIHAKYHCPTGAAARFTSEAAMNET